MRIPIIALAALAALAALSIPVRPARAQSIPADEGEGVSRQTGDPSPRAPESRIDDYTQQDEQINLTDGSGTVKVLRVNQKNLVNDYVTAVFPIHKEPPNELQGVIRLIVGKEGGHSELIRDKVKKENFVHVVCPKFQLPYIEAAVKALDQDWLEANNRGTYRFVYEPRFRGAAAVERIVQNWAPDSAGFVDPDGNRIVRITDNFRIEKYKEGAALVDVPPPEIRIEGAVYETNVQNDLKLGLDFIAWKNGPGRNLFEGILYGNRGRERFSNLSSVLSPILPRTAAAGETVERDLQNRGSYLGANFLLVSAYLDFLASKGKATVVARPRIVTKSGATAEFSALDPIAAFEAQPLDPGPRGLVPSRLDKEKAGDVPIHKRTLRYRAAAGAGLSLTVTPFIGLETTELAVDLTFSEATGLTPQGTPILARRTLSSYVRVRDGETLVLGGLRRRETVRHSAKVPLLGSIPILGWLFGGETNSDRETDLIVVLTVKVAEGGASSLEQPADVEVRNQVLGRAPAPLPENPFGFDQWLLDPGPR